MKYVIVGGVAAGASAAARLRRLDENCEIVLVEKGEYISFANCGLPYHIGNVIPDRQSLLVMSAKNFAKRFNTRVLVKSEVTQIDRANKKVAVCHNGETSWENYDKLLLATGSSPVKLPIPGSDDPAVLHLWTIPDMDQIILQANQARDVVVAGAGFIGLEIAENLKLRNLNVTIVEYGDQVMSPFDKEMSSYLAQELVNHGIRLELGAKLETMERDGKTLHLKLSTGKTLNADLVIMSTGVKPNSQLAQAAGLELGGRGHIKVNDHLQTKDPDIYAAGDVIEVLDPIFGGQTAIALAGPANKQGRIAADNLTGKMQSYHGTLGASVIKIGKLAAASVGYNEKRLKTITTDYYKIYTHPGSNASYYPGGTMMHLKILFGKDGKIFGAQAVGVKGVDKRIDVIATAMRCGKTVTDLAELELCYAPPYNSAKDPVNFLGMIGENILKNLSSPVYVDAIPADAQLVDVREVEEYEQGTIPGAVNIPLGQLRDRLAEIDANKFIVIFCRVGLRGYVAERILKQKNYRCGNLSGGMLTYQAFHAEIKEPPACHAPIKVAAATECPVLDVRTLSCPGPVVRLAKTIKELPVNGELKLLAQSGFEPDLVNYLKSNHLDLLSLDNKEDHLEAIIRKPAACVAAAPAAAAIAPAKDGAAIILFSNDLDKAMAALIVSCGMAAAGMPVTIFFTFWGLSVLRKNPGPVVRKKLMDHMFGWMLPKGVTKLALSKMNMLGMGTLMMKQVMAQQNVPTLPELLQQARELNVKFVACEMAMNVMGLKREELIDIDEVVGVASFAEIARNSNHTLFI